MALTNLEIATRARNLITERSPAEVNITVPHIVALIPTAMEMWARDILNDEEKSDSLVTDYSTSVTGGVLDLTSYFNGTTARISPKDLRGRTIYVTVSGELLPCTWVGSYSQLKFGRYPTDVPAVFLDNSTLRFRNTDGSLTSLTGVNATIKAANIPSSATDIPAELVGDFINYLAGYSVREKMVDGR